MTTTIFDIKPVPGGVLYAHKNMEVAHSTFWPFGHEGSPLPSKIEVTISATPFDDGKKTIFSRLPSWPIAGRNQNAYLFGLDSVMPAFGRYLLNYVRSQYIKEKRFLKYFKSFFFITVQESLYVKIKVLEYPKDFYKLWTPETLTTVLADFKKNSIFGFLCLASQDFQWLWALYNKDIVAIAKDWINADEERKTSITIPPMGWHSGPLFLANDNRKVRIAFIEDEIARLQKLCSTN